MHVVLEEALDSYANELVATLPSDTVDEMENNVNTLAEWIHDWIKFKQSRE